MMEPSTTLSRFLEATVEALREAVVEGNAPDGASARMVEDILTKLPPSPAIARPQPHTLLAACRCMDEAFIACPGDDTAARPALAKLGNALHGLEQHCCWQQNPNYNAQNQSPEFVNGQAYQAYLGPEGLADSNGVAVFSMLLAPGVSYKEHAHPAEELYFILSGTAQWKRGDEKWQDLGAGSLIHHPSNTIHATKTTSKPLLCLAFWTGNLKQRAKVI